MFSRLRRVAGVCAVAVGLGLVADGYAQQGPGTLIGAITEQANTWTASQSFTRDAIATTSTDGVVLQNTTAATSGVTAQYSPRLRFSGTAWKSNATAASQVNSMALELRPVSGAAATTFTWALMASVAGSGSYTDILDGNSDGYLQIGNGASATQIDSSNSRGPYPASDSGATLGISTRRWSTVFGAAGDFSGTLTAANYQRGGTAFAVSQASPSAPTGTNNTTGLMMGLAGAITPANTRIFVTITGSVANDTAPNGAQVQIRYGTGTAPVNGAALTGTTAGSLQQFTLSLSGQKVPFSVSAVITGLTAGTAYWLDTGLAAITAGTATITQVSVSAFDIP